MTLVDDHVMPLDLAHDLGLRLPSNVLVRGQYDLPLVDSLDLVQKNPSGGGRTLEHDRLDSRCPSVELALPIRDG